MVYKSRNSLREKKKRGGGAVGVVWGLGGGVGRKREAEEEAWRVIGRSVQITTLSKLVNIVTIRDQS